MKLLLLIIYHLVIQITIIYAANQYLGCFIDEIGNRDLSIFIGDYEQLTPKQCILACQAQNYLYAAIQYGDECRCGQQYGKYGQVSDEECDYLCSTAEKCGGDNRNSVYNVVNSIEQLPTDSSSLSEKLIRANNDSTQTTNSNSISTSLSNPASGSTGSPTVITSQSLITANLSLSISSSINPMTSTSHTISSMPSSTNSISTAVQSSFMMTNMASNTPISSTNTEEITIPTSYLSTNTIPPLTNTSMLTTIVPNSTSSISVLQSSINPVTNTMNSTESSSMYPITSSPSTSSSLHTDTNETTTNTVSTVSNPTSSQTSTIQSISSSYMIQSTSTMTSIPSSGSVSIGSISLNPISSSGITSNNPSNFSSIMTTEITSTYSSQTTETTSEQSSFISSIPNISFLSSNLLASNSTSIEVQATITSFLYKDISIQTSVNTTTSSSITTTTGNSTASTLQITTTTAPSSDVISTIIIVSSGINFDPNDNATQETIITRLTNIINLAFQCLNNPSYPSCTLARQRRKRQSCSLGYNINLISITEISNTTNSAEYLIDYTVTNPCNQNTYVTPVQVITATSPLSRTLITNMLGYSYDGDFVRSTTIGPTSNPTSDRKLWLIGAILGPIAFALLLICAFCYLHYKCRPRPTNRTLAKAISKAPARTSSHQILANEPVKEKPIVEKDLHALTYANPLVRASPPPGRLTPIQTEKSLPDATEYSVTSEVPLAEIRRQNDVERWRNKLRLQEKFQQSSVPNTNRSEPNQYDNRAFEHDPSNINIQPASDIISKHSPHPIPKSTEIQAGRTKLHRLLDEVLDKADSDEAYNPDSDAERQKRRRQRRRVNSISNDQNIPLSNPQTPHIPVIPQVSERPDPSLVRLRYNPYEAGDRAHDISRLTPVELKPKYITDDQRSTQYSSRSNPPLFYDESSIVDRAATATDAYANPKRFGKTRLETDHQADIRHDGGRIDQRQHKFHDDAVHIDTIPRNRDSYRVQARAVWIEPDTDNDSFEKNDFRTAKRSITNTRNIISSIHNELQHIPGSTFGDYHA